jgi:hypothetical protein
MLGTTANAVANLEALVEGYGSASRAFLVVPMVGALFIDFTKRLGHHNPRQLLEIANRWPQNWIDGIFRILPKPAAVRTRSPCTNSEERG